nr:hypothetical protein [Tanacetum cinerariifolium]
MAANLTVASTSECLFADFLSEIEPKKVSEALKHLGWVDVMNKKDEHGITTKNKARLVAQCYSQEEGIEYDSNPKKSHLTAMKRILRYLKGACQILGGKLMKSQLNDYDIHYKMVPIFCDNTSAIAISSNPVLHSRTKHTDIRYHFIRDYILKRDIELHFILTKYQIVDILTKPLDEPTFTRLKAKLGMLNID